METILSTKVLAGLDFTGLVFLNLIPITDSKLDKQIVCVIVGSIYSRDKSYFFCGRWHYTITTAVFFLPTCSADTAIRDALFR